MKQPDVKLNPQPRMRYEITATIHGAPGALDAIEGHVDYEVSNPDCVPMTPVMGATVVPQKSVPVTFRRTGDNVYTGEIFLDRLQDEDYFNQGVCHWSVVGVAAAFRHGQVSFSPSIYKKDILGKHDVVKYFSHASYEHAERQRIDIGANDPQAFQSNATFSITMHAAERLP
ncbi:hypothetical protein P3W24_03470 [Luteibacter sp. PPL201]|uniref:Uncharacterized protein n=1 Tax=Luteibacter sahnii TaxID=3021977 RepID=A0ABT6B7G7_9GAMM|nr:hypothetical protein [Luteibacter sp. PPL193]MDY1548016.1 hypothetical protein [Luteibacter sp. PPL193]